MDGNLEGLRAKRDAARLQKSKPVPDAFRAWIQGLDTMENFAVTKATGYATGQKACLESFLPVRLPLLGKGSDDGLEALAPWGAETRMACRGAI
ncbi:MAG: hypothetical protein RR893_04710 [Clostridia bacterium]